jgi:ATP-dependent DNA helicase RecG
MPHYSIEKLQKFFKLESERGYDNRAVVGGLDKILTSWEAEARADNLREEWIRTVVEQLKAYPDADPPARSDMLKRLWKMLHITGEEHPLEGKYHPQAQNRNNAERHVQPPRQQPVHHQAVEVPSLATGLKPANKVENINIPPTPRPNEQPPEIKISGLKAPLTVIQGVGPRHAQTLGNLGLKTLGDLIYYFPRRYDDYSQLVPINRLQYGEVVTVIANIDSVITRPLRGGQSQITEVIVSDGTGAMRLVWFNQPWQVNHLRRGMPVTISGRADQYLGRLVFNNPEVEPIDQEQLHTNRIVPVYPLTARITQRWLRRLMYQTVTYWAPRMPDYLPQYIRQSAGIIDLPTALLQSHFPDSQVRLKAARERLAFDEIFLLQLGVLRQKNVWQSLSADIFNTPDDWLQDQVHRLPFSLTKAQEKALTDVRNDLCSGKPMNRLLQGDVGSGKTVIAALAVAMVARYGMQSAVMSPTSILAEQHFRSFTSLMCSRDDQPGGVLCTDEVALLLGDTPDAEKRTIYEGLANGKIRLVISTHAVLESPVAFEHLQLVVVDEQHRFGVAQRAALRAKGSNPHLLVMTATPIPRSLALTVYGDLDLTVLDEMPAGRQVIETHLLHPRERERAYSLIRSQVEKGHQVFIIYPLVEQGDDGEGKAAVEEHERLQRIIFPKLKLGLVHGRLKAEEKDAVMSRFRNGEFQVLVSTSVVEVGVDIPNATVMLVEGANRFGLAQLHQFRGRVGRGTAQSYCLLIPEKDDALENERLAAMAETNDGFILAERDLQQRGPGDFLGTRQAGFAELKMANLSDVRLIEKARVQAQAVFSKDPELQSNEHLILLQMLNRFWNEGQGDIS